MAVLLEEMHQGTRKSGMVQPKRRAASLQAVEDPSIGADFGDVYVG